MIYRLDMGPRETGFKRRDAVAVGACPAAGVLQSCRSALPAGPAHRPGSPAIIKRILLLVILLAILGLVVFWVITAPITLAADDLPDHAPDVENGAYMFLAGGCSSCHAAPGAKDEDKLILSGGLALSTPFGKFHAPNISPDPNHGIGDWTLADFVTSMKYGVGRNGEHLYPAFPYTSYQRMSVEDIIDLKAYLDTLPPSANNPPPHELPFPFNFRRGLGLWQLLYVDGRAYQPKSDMSEELNRGAYLVEGPGHCGECHSPRNFIGGVEQSRAFSGGPAPEGDGRIPNITPDPQTGLGDWSEEEIVELLTTGFTPEFDSVGGAMAHVVQNTAQLTREDRAAIAQFLKALPPIRSASN
jgi:mono/diheme cytochrome c family protein